MKRSQFIRRVIKTLRLLSYIASAVRIMDVVLMHRDGIWSLIDSFPW